MPLGRGVHLLLQHPLVDGADGVLRPAENLGVHPLSQLETEFGDRAANRALDPLGSESRLVVALSLAPLLRAVGAADRHSDDRDRRMDAAERRHPGNPPARANDHRAADLLTQDAVGRTDVVGAFGRDRGRLQTEPRLLESHSRLVDDRVVRRPPRLQGEVEARELELETDYVRRENANRLLEELLTRLVALEHHDSLRIHGGRF